MSGFTKVQSIALPFEIFEGFIPALVCTYMYVYYSTHRQTDGQTNRQRYTHTQKQKHKQNTQNTQISPLLF